MKVFKFGGASVNSIERIKNLPPIISFYKGEPMLVIVSAMGKTTNALEKVAESFYAGRTEEALGLFEQVKQQHLNTVKYLLVTHAVSAENKMQEVFTEVEWLLHDKPVRHFDYYYDQVVCSGELLSTIIISAWLNEAGLSNTWLDVRDVLRTDDNFRDANIDWDFTRNRVAGEMAGLFSKNGLVVTQGFIGSTSENESTTLGREGSDYTAAVFTHLLDADHLTIWKDVHGVMSADPKAFPDAILLPHLDFDEVIEMAYYGAQVIHPKTIKPLQNKNIPLYVKCFLDPTLPGTAINAQPVKGLPPIIVLKQKQALMHLHSKDFSFVGEKPIARLYEMLALLKIKPNLVQNGAVRIMVCLDDHSDKIERLALAASELFDVQVEKNLTLLTIRHYNNEVADALIAGKKIVLRQESEATLQVLMSEG
jgi:aspartate kinase